MSHLFLSTLLAVSALGISRAEGEDLLRPIPHSGTLHVRLIGNGKICVRMHEREVVEMISPGRRPKGPFSSFAYRLRLTAVSQSEPQARTVLLDTGRVRTAMKKKPPKPAAANRNPGKQGTIRDEDDQTFPYIWLRHEACSSFPRSSHHALSPGEYVLQILFKVQSPNGSWFTVMEKTGMQVRVSRGVTAETRIRFLDDGNRREIDFF